MTYTIVITGASTGIGRASALAFAKRGWRVAATMRQPDAVRDLPETPNLRRVRMDVTDAGSIQEGLAQVRREFGPVDVLVNNAGYGLFGPFEAASEEQVRTQFETNLFGAMAMMRAVLPEMRERRRGMILNVSSIGGRIGFPMSSLYHATKFGLEGLTEAIRFELSGFGIQCKLIEPGGIRTDFAKRSLVFPSHPAYRLQEQNYRAVLRNEKYWATPEQVAQVIWRAATDGSNRLRYPAKPGPFLLLHGLLPDRVWRGLMNGLLYRKSGGRAVPVEG